MKKRVAFIGAGSHADAVFPILDRTCYEFVGFFDDKPILQHAGYPILGTISHVLEFLENKKVDAVFITIGDNEKRREVFEMIADRFYDSLINIISEQAALLTPEESIQGRGIFIGYGAFIGSKVILQDNTVVNTSALIEHHTHVSAHCNIAPNATINGLCHLEENVYVGSGSVVIQLKRICAHTMIGAGAVVVKDIEKRGTYVGVPAKRLNKEEIE